MMARARSLPVLLLLGSAACADPAPGPSPAAAPALSAVGPTGAATITASDLRARVAFLASDALRGRDTPSPGLEAAAAYLVSEYQRLGLEPGGENGTYYQRYPLRTLALDSATVHFGTVLGDGSGNEMLRYGTDFYAAAVPPRPGVDMNHARLVHVGPLPASGLPQADYRGTVPIVSVEGAYTRAWRAEVARARRAAREAGATGLAVEVDAEFPSATFQELAQRSRLPLVGLTDADEIPVFYLSQEGARRIRAREPGLGRVAGAGGAVPFREVRAHFAAAQRVVQDARPPNVAAILRGSDPALRHEYVVLSSHMDHVGVGRPVNGDSIYNGADDDASGTAGILEVAEALASMPTRPRRSILFLHVSGEEKGLLGSRWYSDHPTVPLERIIANINVDMIGRNAPDTVVVIGKEYSSLGAVANRVQREHPELGLTLSDDIWPEERFFFRSDHFNFARKEIPSLFFFTGVHEDYHQPSDEVDKLDADKAARISRMILHTAQAIANEPQRPTWDPKGLAEVRGMTR